VSVTTGHDSHAPDPRDLFAAYRAALRTAGDVPRVLLLRRRRGRLGWVIRAVRLRAFARFFVLFHVSRSAASLRRLYNGASSLHPEDVSYERGAKQVEAFEKSLPPHHPRRMFVLFLISVFFISFLMARIAPEFDPTMSSMIEESSDKSAPTMRVSADSLGKMTAASLTLNPGEFAQALKSFACYREGTGEARHTNCSPKLGLTTSVASLILLGVAVWLVTFLPVSSFRLKRMLFNLGPAGVDGLRSQAAIEHVDKADGIYRVEADVFRRLGARPPREVPFDLLSQAGVLVLPVWLSLLAVPVTVSWIRFVRDWGLYQGNLLAFVLVLYGAALIFTLPSARLMSLRRTNRRRVAAAADPQPGGSTLTSEAASWSRRLLAHLLDGAFVAAIGIPFGLLLWARIENEEMRALLVVFLVPILAWGIYESLSFLRAGPRAGQTIGKQLLGLRVVCTRSGRVPGMRRLLFREIFLRGFLFGPTTLALPFLFSALQVDYVALLLLPFLAYALNYLFALFHYRHCALHDLISDTVVVPEARAPALARVALAQT
jgi:uncharacterized RDD family membrane protein YckC